MIPWAVSYTHLWYDNEWGYSCQVVRMLDHMSTSDAEEEAKAADAAKK